MPTYSLICPAPNCQHCWETFAHASERDAQICPKCATKAETNFQASTPKIRKPWDELSGRHWGMAFDPKGLKELKREAPSIELDQDGHVHFRSDAHQRQVYREIAATRQRYEDEKQARLDRRAHTDDDIDAAAKAVSEFETAKGL